MTVDSAEGTRTIIALYLYKLHGRLNYIPIVLKKRILSVRYVCHDGRLLEVSDRTNGLYVNN